MSKLYTYNLSHDGVQSLIKSLNKIKSAMLGDDFIEYIGKLAYRELEEQTVKSLNTDLEDEYIHTYRSNHTMKIDYNEKSITLSNETMVDLSSLNLSEETRANYPNGLSLAKIVEFGTGPAGAESEASSQAEDWQYNVNQSEHIKKYGSDKWAYVNQEGQVVWTRGVEGSLIFYKTKQAVEQKIESWVSEYLDRKIGV